MSGCKMRIAASGEVYAYYIEKLNKYCAYQIISTDKDSICCLALDYLEQELPAAEILAQLQPFCWESFRCHHQMENTRIENTPVPWDYIFVGKCGLKTDVSCNSYSGIWSNGWVYIREERWKSLGQWI